MKRNLLFLALLLVLAIAGAAQSNEFMDGIMESKAITAGEASYLVLAGAERIGEDADAGAAFAKAEEAGWTPKGASAGDPIDYAGYSQLVMKAFELKGGIMYSLTRAPRYAYRELVSRRLIQGRADPRMKVDGLAALRVLGRALDASAPGAQGRAK